MQGLVQLRPKIPIGTFVPRCSFHPGQFSTTFLGLPIEACPQRVQAFACLFEQWWLQALPAPHWDFVTRAVLGTGNGLTSYSSLSSSHFIVFESFANVGQVYLK